MNYLFTIFQASTQLLASQNNFIIRLYRYRFAKMLVDIVSQLRTIDKQSRIRHCNETVTEEDWIEGNVGTAKVEQPGDFIKHVCNQPDSFWLACFEHLSNFSELLID